MDNTYIKFLLDPSDSNLSYDTTFTITYDAANSYITDLAGNRLRSISLSVTNMESIDRTSPEFDLVIAPVTITFGFDKNFSSSAFTIANCKALVFNNTVTLTTLTVDKTDSITTNGTTSITNISDTTNSGTYTFNNGVTFANNVTLNSTKLVTFKGTSNIGAAGSRKDFTHTNGITNINDTFNAKDVSLGAMTSTTDVTIDAHDISIAGTLTTDEKLTVNNGNNITVQLHFPGILF